MLRKRLIGVVTVRDGWAVQSIGYSRYLPMGRPEVLVENLDRWGADEILLNCIDCSRLGLGPALELVERVGRLGLSTPLVYSGGIRSVEEAVAIVKAGADRVVVDALLRDDPSVAVRIGEPLGAQAVIAALPLTATEEGLHWYDYRAGTAAPLPPEMIDLLGSGAISEVLAIDWRNEGRPSGFDTRLVTDFPVPGVPLIAFGGISEAEQLRALLGEPQVAAAAVGNFLSYGEHAVQRLKASLAGLPMRPPTYMARSEAAQ